MRGLAFPEAAVSDRDESTDHGTPFSSSNADDIPIDPALTGIPLDPALFDQTNEIPAQQTPQPESPVDNTPVHYNHFYSQVPQGDPFIPFPPPSYVPVPVEQPSMPTPKPPRKKRKVAREKECGFCRAKGSKNSIPERLLTCAECGRSGHPSCLQISKLGGVVYQYDWHCIDCKFCEVCREKGNENRLLFCDVCDRGWHMDCLQPPLDDAPSGDWSCPNCPPREPTQLEDAPYSVPTPDHANPNQHFVLPPTPRAREHSVASSSRSAPRTTTRSKRKGKARAVTTDESEVDADGEIEAEVEVDVEVTPVPAKKKGKPPGRSKKESEPPEEAMQPEPSRPPLRNVRLRLSSPAPPVPPPKLTPVIRLKLTTKTAKGKEREEEPDEAKKSMFEDLLSVEDRDTSQTQIQNSDKARFDRSRSEAERVMYPPKHPTTPLEPPDTPIAGPSSRPLRSAYIQPPPPPTPLSESPVPQTPDFTKLNGVPTHRIRTIRFGEFDIDTWYDAPFPEEYANLPDGRLWICEFCLKYMKSQFVAIRHQMKCKMRHPPGDEIYRDGTISVFEVDGRKNKIYCQNLCLLSKMFLDHKSLFYDVEPFLFYVMTEADDSAGSRFVGYFSKEKRSPKDYNVSCIMTLPVRQRRGWGNLLIDFSYLLSKKEHRTGSPEKPLSALGALSYKNYWTLALMRYLREAPENPRLEDIAEATSLTIEDIYVTLQQQQMISVRDHTPPTRPPPGKSIKFPKGKKNGIARKHLVRSTTHDDYGHSSGKGPFVPPRLYDIIWDPNVVEAYMAKWESKGYFKLKPDCLQWSPFLIARTMKSEGVAEDEGVAGSGAVAQDPLETPVDEVASDTNGFLLGEDIGSATPRPGSSKSKSKSRRTPRNRQLEGVLSNSVSRSNAASPISNLFDEPLEMDPEELPTLPEATRSSTRLARKAAVAEEEEEEEGPVSARRRRTSREEEQEEEEEEVVPRRSGRHSTILSSSVSPSQVSTQSSAQKARKPRPSRNRTASSNGINGINGNPRHEATPSEVASMVSLIADDEALAKRLAMEDELPRRQLRSRSNTSQEVKTLAQLQPPVQPQTRAQKRDRIPAVPATPPLPPPRKRRRIDASPDLPSSPPALPPPAKRRASGANVRERNKPSTPIAANGNSHQRRSSRRTNGVAASETPSPELHRTRSGAVRRRIESPIEDSDDEDGGKPEDDGHVPESASASLSANTSASAQAPDSHAHANPNGEDVKYEDMDTPLTGMSRQSAPSDDTVYVPEEQQRMKVTPVSPVAFEPQSRVQNAFIPPFPVGDEDGDADAEGEDDIDAEGEPDDGEYVNPEDDGEDVDAEGEVDDGLDGEGEVVMMV